ncbi:Uncharacterised protein [Candidatus Venteria ishoeyi]|uniref:Uncharacterized protein n=1 Tax=Candidatus Venteria ishoeyi TaxID=1899563 RepID=A0A1H6F7C7_9GAMM|nr:Uncharacterised protein [Candidatus Venteria ishoeyi]
MRALLSIAQLVLKNFTRNRFCLDFFPYLPTASQTHLPEQHPLHHRMLLIDRRQPLILLFHLLHCVAYGLHQMRIRAAAQGWQQMPGKITVAPFIIAPGAVTVQSRVYHHHAIDRVHRAEFAAAAETFAFFKDKLVAAGI